MAKRESGRSDPSPIAVETVAPDTAHVLVEWVLTHGAEHDDSFAAEAGMPAASLSTSSTNEPALGLYTSQGFEVTERRVCWGGTLIR